MQRLIFLAGMLLGTQAMANGAVEPVVKWTLLDQNDKAYTLDSQAHVLLVARSMSASCQCGVGWPILWRQRW